ncbi:MAG: potassium-transporting ATPase subunit KdpC [Chitinispirillaceae bacterium]|jgi:K+-transporting ATPase ATPase C chain
MKQLLASFRIFIVLTLLTGVLYPLAVTAVARLIFPYRAGGSLVVVHKKVVGSELIGQQFTSQRYFQARPSAIAYNPLPSGGSNLSCTSLQLWDSVETRGRMFRTVNRLPRQTVVPPDMLFASASGLDPDISPESARLQIARVARERKFSKAERAALASLVEHAVFLPQMGFLGEPRVNVLRLNETLDKINNPAASGGVSK